MQAEGYDTAAIGKWHIGAHSSGATQLGNRPEHQGVELYQGILDGGRHYFDGTETVLEKQLRETISDGARSVSSDTTLEGTFAGQ